MINVLSMLFGVVLIKCIEKLTQRTFIEDDFHFDGIKFPADNDTDTFEELNQNVSVNMFEVDDENEKTVISRKLKKDAGCPYWCVEDWWGWQWSFCKKSCSRRLNSQKSKFRKKILLLQILS